VLVDDGSSKTEVARITEYLIHRLGIELLLGPYSSSLTGAAAEIVNHTGRVLVAPASSSTSVYRDRPQVFGTLTPSSKFLLGAMRVVGKADGGSRKTLAYIQEDLSWSRGVCSQVSNLASLNNLDLVQNVTVPGDASSEEVRTAVQQLVNVKADVLVGCVYRNVCHRLLRAASDLAFNPKAIILTICVTEADFVEQLGITSQFIVGVTPWMPSLPLQSSLTSLSAQNFSDAYERRYREVPPYQAASAFCACATLVRAIEQANSTDPGAVATALRSFDERSIFGRVAFDANGQNLNEFKAVQHQLDRGLVLVSDDDSLLRYPMPTWTQRRCYGGGQAGGGYGFANGSDECLPCAAGHVSVISTAAGSRLGQRICVACPVRTYASQLGVCEPCRPGHYSAVEASAWCPPCREGTYQERSGSLSCMMCPQNTSSALAATNLTDCRCEKGYFTRTGTRGIACQPCPIGAICTGKESQPFSKPKHYAVGHPTGQYLRCVSGFELNPCLGGSEGQLNSCMIGYTGVSCSRCSKGFFRLGRECYACSEAGPTKLYFVLLLAFFYFLRRVANTQIKTLYIFLSFLQVFGLQSAYRMEWTPSVKLLLRIVQVANIQVDLLVPFCDQEILFPYKYTAYFFMPVFFLMVDGLILGIRILLQRHRKGSTSAKSADTAVAQTEKPTPKLERQMSDYRADEKVDIHEGTTALEILKNFAAQGVINVRLMYVPLFGRTLDMLRCTNLEEGPPRLSRDPDLTCWDGIHLSFMPMVWFAMLFYCICTPILYIVVLVRGYQNGDLYTEAHLRRWGLLYQRYEQDWFFWELCFIFRRILAVMIKTMFNIRLAHLQVSGYLGNYQAALNCVVMVIAMVAHFYARPFNDPYQDFGDACYMACTFMSSLIGICFSAAKTQWEVEMLESLFFLNFFAACVVTAFLLWRDAERLSTRAQRLRHQLCWPCVALLRPVMGEKVVETLLEDAKDLETEIKDLEEEVAAAKSAFEVVRRGFEADRAHAWKAGKAPSEILGREYWKKYESLELLMGKLSFLKEEEKVKTRDFDFEAEGPEHEAQVHVQSAGPSPFLMKVSPWAGVVRKEAHEKCEEAARKEEEQQQKEERGEEDKEIVDVAVAPGHGRISKAQLEEDLLWYRGAYRRNCDEQARLRVELSQAQELLLADRVRFDEERTAAAQRAELKEAHLEQELERRRPPLELPALRQEARERVRESQLAHLHSQVNRARTVRSEETLGNAIQLYSRLLAEVAAEGAGEHRPRVTFSQVAQEQAALQHCLPNDEATI